MHGWAWICTYGPAAAGRLFNMGHGTNDRYTTDSVLNSDTFLSFTVAVTIPLPVKVGSRWTQLVKYICMSAQL
jgi:hypothetical protein